MTSTDTQATLFDWKEYKTSDLDLMINSTEELNKSCEIRHKWLRAAEHVVNSVVYSYFVNTNNSFLQF